MVSSSTCAARADQSGSPIGLEYFEIRRAAVNGFMERHFRWPGTLRLHRAALGWNSLRAALNVVLSPVLVLARVAAWLYCGVSFHTVADWLARQRFIFRTAVARRVEVLNVSGLLDLPLDERSADRDS